MKAYRFILVVLALAGLSVAREAPGPEIGAVNNPADIPVINPAGNAQAGTQAGITAEEWIDILAPVLAAARDEEQDP